MTRLVMETYLMRFVRYVLDWRKTRGVIKELNKLSDKQLKDIGMTRGEISHLIYTLEDETKRGRS